MSLSQKLLNQVLLIFKPTEATSPVLDLILSLFTARVLTFEPLVAQLPSCLCSWPSSKSNFAKFKLKLCEHYFKLKQAFFSSK